MIIKSYTQIAAFFKDNLAFLEQEEAANNLMLGILMALQKQKVSDPSLVLLSIFEQDQPILVGMQTPPRNLILYASKAHQSEAIAVLIPFLLSQKNHVPGVVAQESLAKHFAEQWETATGKRWKNIFDHLIYRLDKLEKRLYSKGKLRLMKQEEMDLASHWMGDFLEEAMHNRDEIEAKNLAKKHIDAGTLYVWEHEEVVTMAVVNRPTRHGITVSYVYTPPAHRGKGYASTCVAQMSALMLEKYDFCTLFADSANPTSNRIYARMGYQVIERYRMIEFLDNGYEE